MRFIVNKKKRIGPNSTVVFEIHAKVVLTQEEDFLYQEFRIWQAGTLDLPNVDKEQNHSHLYPIEDLYRGNPKECINLGWAIKMIQGANQSAESLYRYLEVARTYDDVEGWDTTPIAPEA